MVCQHAVQKKGTGSVLSEMTTCEAFDRQHKPEGLTAPSDESILCVFTYHRRGSAPINVCVRFFYGNVPRLSRLLLCKWL